jgi:hypothetical protein
MWIIQMFNLFMLIKASKSTLHFFKQHFCQKLSKLATQKKRRNFLAYFRRLNSCFFFKNVRFLIRSLWDFFSFYRFLCAIYGEQSKSMVLFRFIKIFAKKKDTMSNLEHILAKICSKFDQNRHITLFCKFFYKSKKYHTFTVFPINSTKMVKNKKSL